MEAIKRDLYLNRLIDRKDNGLIKVITGIRRCGKSYLLFKLYYQYLLDSGVSADGISWPWGRGEGVPAFFFGICVGLSRGQI